MIGPGKYDEECTALREKTGADAVLLLIFNGSKGNGFACQSADADVFFSIPRLLRNMADFIEADQERGIL